MLNTIQIKLFAFIFFIVITFVKVQMDSDNMISENQFGSDVTHGLTDNDLNLALSDLPLKALKSLQTLIDSADYNDLYYQENGPAKEKFHSYDFDQEEFDNSNDNPGDDDYSFKPKDITNNFVKGKRAFYTVIQENQRAKRDDQKLNSNEEYIKQLVYSFPQNEQQNYQDIDREKSYIRVKRN